MQRQAEKWQLLKCHSRCPEKSEGILTARALEFQDMCVTLPRVCKMLETLQPLISFLVLLDG